MGVQGAMGVQNAMDARDAGDAKTTADVTRRPAVGPERAPRWWWVTLAALAAVAAIVAVAGSLWLTPLLTENSDEGSYLAQATALRAGQLLPVAPAANTAAFRPWFTALRDGHFVYKYSPVHPAMLAAARTIGGSERVALGLIAAGVVVAVALFAREIGASPRASLLAAAFVLGAPLFLVQSITFLPYVDMLLLLLGFATLLLRGARRSSARALTGAGLLLGVAVWLRPFDALLFALPVLGWQLLRPAHPDRRRTLAFVGLGVLPGLLGFLAFNAAATGSPFELPFRLLDRADTVGLGRHRVLSTDSYVDYTLARALEATQKNVLLLVTWSFGSIVLVALGVYGWVTRPRVPHRSLLLVLTIAWPVGFFFFWGSYTYVFLWGGGLRLGPWYYLPLLVPISVMGGIGLDRLLDRARVLAVLAAVLCVAFAAPVVADAIDGLQARTAQREAVHDAVTAATSGGRALVLLPSVWGPYLQNPFSFWRNSPDYDGARVYALEGGNRDLGVVADHAGRAVFVLSMPSGFSTGQGTDVPMWIDRQHEETASAVDLSVAVPKELAGVPLALEVGSRNRVVRGPVTNGKATVRVTSVGPGRVLVSIPGGDGTTGSSPPVELSRSELASGLDVALSQDLGGGQRRALVRRKVPIRAGREISVLWPGTVSGSVLPPSTALRWIAAAR